MKTIPPLPNILTHIAKQGRNDFTISKSNQGAIYWIDQWPNWPHDLFIIVGPAGSGKSHLLNIWCKKTGALILSGKESSDMQERRMQQIMSHLSQQQAEGKNGQKDRLAVAIDDADLITEQSHLFDILTYLQRDTPYLLMTMREAPAFWVEEARVELVSRLNTGLITRLETPDDELMQALLTNLFAQRQLRVDDDLIKYLVMNLPRDFSLCQKFVEEFDQYARIQQRKMTKPLAISLLKSMNEQGFFE